MNFLFLDLEFNKDSNKIIQIGFCIADMQSFRVLEEKRIYINPNEKLHPEIIKLTGISQKQVDSGLSLIEGFKQVRSSFVIHGCYRSPFTWGINDLELLKKQVFALDSNHVWPFGSRTNDIQAIVFGFFLKSHGQIMEMSLEESLLRIGIPLSGRSHDALNDSKNMFYLLCHLLETNKKKRGQMPPLKRYIQR